MLGRGFSRLGLMNADSTSWRGHRASSGRKVKHEATQRQEVVHRKTIAGTGRPIIGGWEPITGVVVAIVPKSV